MKKNVHFPSSKNRQGANDTGSGIVYDNQTGDADTAAPSTIIAGGLTVILKEKWRIQASPQKKARPPWEGSGSMVDLFNS